jgi:hypothetical protein
MKCRRQYVKLRKQDYQYEKIMFSYVGTSKWRHQVTYIELFISYFTLTHATYPLTPKGLIWDKRSQICASI